MTVKKTAFFPLLFLFVVLLAGCGGGLNQLKNPLSKSSHTPLPAEIPPQPDPTETSAPASSGLEKGESEMIAITLVYDNYPYQAGMETDWGFSALISSGDQNLLFDTGYNGSLLLRNMGDLKIEPSSIQRVVLSHEHGDHIGGLAALLSAGADPVIYHPPSFSAGFTRSYQNRQELIPVSAGMEIFDGVYSLGEMPGPPPEQSLVIETSQGLVVITGCAHPGIVSIIKQAKRLFDQEIYLVLGGFHLGDKSDEQMDQIIAEFKDLGVQHAAPCHCTGERQIGMFRQAYGEDFIQVGVGMVIEIDL